MQLVERAFPSDPQSARKRDRQVIGILLGEAFYCFPAALLILTTALSLSDQRLYDAATLNEELTGTAKRHAYWWEGKDSGDTGWSGPSGGSTAHDDDGGS